MAFISASARTAFNLAASVQVTLNIPAGTKHVVIPMGGVKSTGVTFTVMVGVDAGGAGGTAATQVALRADNPGGYDSFAGLWELIDPPTGSVNLKITASAANNAGHFCALFYDTHLAFGTPVPGGGTVPASPNQSVLAVSSAAGSIVLDVLGGEAFTAASASHTLRMALTPSDNSYIGASQEAPGAATVNIGYTNLNVGLKYSHVAVSISEGAPPGGPNIASVSDDTPLNGQSINIAGTNFGAAGPVVLGGTTLTPTARSATSIDAPALRGANRYLQSVNLTVSDGTTTSNAWPVTLQPDAGWGFLILTSIAAAGVPTATPPLAVGDGVHWDTKGGSVTFLANGTWVYDPNITPGVTSFAAEAWRSGDGWGSLGTITINGSATPSPILYPSLGGLPLAAGPVGTFVLALPAGTAAVQRGATGAAAPAGAAVASKQAISATTERASPRGVATAGKAASSAAHASAAARGTLSAGKGAAIQAQGSTAARGSAAGAKAIAQPAVSVAGPRGQAAGATLTTRQNATTAGPRAAAVSVKAATTAALGGASSLAVVASGKAASAAAVGRVGGSAVSGRSAGLSSPAQGVLGGRGAAGGQKQASSPATVAAAPLAVASAAKRSNSPTTAALANRADVGSAKAVEAAAVGRAGARALGVGVAVSGAVGVAFGTAAPRGSAVASKAGLANAESTAGLTSRAVSGKAAVSAAVGRGGGGAAATSAKASAAAADGPRAALRAEALSTRDLVQRGAVGRLGASGSVQSIAGEASAPPEVNIPPGGGGGKFGRRRSAARRVTTAAPQAPRHVVSFAHGRLGARAEVAAARATTAAVDFVVRAAATATATRTGWAAADQQVADLQARLAAVTQDRDYWFLAARRNSG